MLEYSNDVSKAEFNDVAIDDSVKSTFNENDGVNAYRWESFVRARLSRTKEKRPDNWYPLYVSPDLQIIDSKYHEGFEEVWPIVSSGDYTWKNKKEKFDELNHDGYFKAVKENDKIFIYHRYYENQVLKNLWIEKKYQSEFNGTNLLKDMFGTTSLFSYPKSIYAVEDSIKLALKEKESVIDYFAGSGTTGHAIIDLNRESNNAYKFILCEMGEYFNTVTKPRIEKAIYSKEWKLGKPVARDGISQCFKYLKLESYEDSLNNIKFSNSIEYLPEGLKEEYLLKYMINMETKESMFNVDKLAHPFNYVMDITQKQETKKTVMDIVESFNYLIGLVIERSYAKKSYDATFSTGEYGALEAHISDGKTYTIKLIKGHSLSGDKILVIWRDMTDDISKDNAVLDAVLAKRDIDVDVFDRIYVNGDNNLNNTNGNKVFLIEDEMQKRMFED